MEEVFVPVARKQFKEIHIESEIGEEPTCDRTSEHHMPQVEAVPASVLEHNIFEE